MIPSHISKVEEIARRVVDTDGHDEGSRDVGYIVCTVNHILCVEHGGIAVH
jgi:hypothetical protein